MIYTIKRASDSINCGAVWQSPCSRAQPISVLSQIRHYHPWRYEVWPTPLRIHIVELEALDDFKQLIEEVGPIIMYASPYAATPGTNSDDSPWSEAVRGLDSEPLEVLSGASGIIIYDNYME